MPTIASATSGHTRLRRATIIGGDCAITGNIPSIPDGGSPTSVSTEGKPSSLSSSSSRASSSGWTISGIVERPAAAAPGAPGTSRWIASDTCWLRRARSAANLLRT